VKDEPTDCLHRPTTRRPGTISERIGRSAASESEGVVYETESFGGHELSAGLRPWPRGAGWRGAATPRVSAAIAVAVTVAVSVGCTSSRQQASTAGPRSAAEVQQATFSGITLRFPATWHAVTPTFVTGALFAPIGWITSEDPGPQCTPDAVSGHIGCHAPIDTLTDGGLLVSLTESGGAPIGGDFNPNTTFAGLPAQSTQTDGSHCGSVAAVTGIDLLAKEPGRFLSLTVCFGAHSQDVQASVRDMLANATYEDH
jgi:hypothetical protein